MNVIVVSMTSTKRLQGIYSNRGKVWRMLKTEYVNIDRIFADDAHSTGVALRKRVKSLRTFSNYLQDKEPIHIECETAGKSFVRLSVQVHPLK